MKAGSILQVLLLLLMASCSLSGDPKRERDLRAETMTGDIVIGVPAPWTWLRSTGHYYWQGIEMALDELNRSGGVLGRRIRLLKEDDEGEAPKGKTIARKFTENPDVVAVLGHFNSYISIITSTSYEYYGILMLSPTCTSPELTHRRGFTRVFRNIPNDGKNGKDLAKFAVDRGWKRVAIYYVNDDYGRGLANSFELHSTKLGCTIIDRLSYDFTATPLYFQRDLAYWKKNFTFDAIFLGGVVPEAAEFIVEARRLGITVPIFGGDGLDSPELWRVGGDSVEGVIVGTYFHPGDPRPEVQNFDREFTKRYGQRPDTWAAQGYDALKLLAYAMQRAGTAAPGRVARTLREMKNWVGVTGPHTFNSEGDVISKQLKILVVKNRQLELLGE